MKTLRESSRALLEWFREWRQRLEFDRLMYGTKYRWKCRRKDGGGAFETALMKFDDMVRHMDTCGYKVMHVDHAQKFVFYRTD